MILQVFPTPVHILGHVIMARWNSSSFLHVNYKVKVKFTLEQPLKAQRGADV
jgi:hypothetical protein